jgi:transaldolase
MNRLQAIRPYGQRIWLDNLSRELLISGELARLIKQDGIAGVTSNPTIFHKAISTDPRYRDDLAALQARGMGAEKTYEELVIPDVRTACDMMLPVYQQSQGDDGYVSLEVSPMLSQDTEGTLLSARHLWQAVGRPNLMVKIPATPEGIAAFGVLTREGINVNITLLFSLKQVEAVWDAYIGALRARLADGNALNHVKAVASFFLSRVDSLLDAKLPAEQGGRVAIAMAKTAYARYLERFHGAEFADLHQAGAHAQYLLWASTGTKNPAYSDVLYVEQLIGAETINTVPDATMAKFRDHGVAAATLRQDLEQARKVLDDLPAAGIDLDAVGLQLQQDGLKMFVDSFKALLELTA